MRTKFLLWPRNFEGTHWHWMCRANIIERIRKVDVGGSDEWGRYSWEWCEEEICLPDP